MRKVIKYAGRDIIRVNQNGRRQGFYKSSGKSSKMKGVWLPFNGITCPAWFDKEEFCHPMIPPELHRFGTEENKKISDKLGKQSIPEGLEVDEIEVNRFLGAVEHMKDWIRLREILK